MLNIQYDQPDLFSSDCKKIWKFTQIQKEQNLSCIYKIYYLFSFQKSHDQLT